MDQTGKQQYHIPALIHDRTMAIRTSYLAWQLVPGGLLGRIVPLQVVVAMHEVNVFLVKDCCPLKGSRCRIVSQMQRKSIEPRNNIVDE